MEIDQEYKSCLPLPAPACPLSEPVGKHLLATPDEVRQHSIVDMKCDFFPPGAWSIAADGS